MAELELHADGKTLRFALENPKWCKLYLSDKKEIFSLGADSLEIIVSRLLIGFLSVPNRKYFTYENRELFSIVNLADPHSVIAGREMDNEGLELSFLGIDNKIHTIALTIQDKQEWVRKIITFLCRCMVDGWEYETEEDIK